MATYGKALRREFIFEVVKARVALSAEQSRQRSLFGPGML
jgi:hypothetical protein